MPTTHELDKSYFEPGDFDAKQQAAVLALSTEPNETGCRFWKGRFADDATPVTMLFRANRTAVFVPVARLWGSTKKPEWIDETAYTTCGDYCCVAPEHAALNKPPENIKQRARKRYRCKVDGHDPNDTAPSGACRPCHREKQERIKTLSEAFKMTPAVFRATYRTALPLLTMIEEALVYAGVESAKRTADDIARK